ncbi:hypothetical protein B0H13DRAFT_1868207 [Mycena leptocephala]|nr:hypothetical protein B0H13DRAFT_1868207 [Mycena leptocephala]
MSSTAPRSDGKPSRYSGINPFKAPIPPGAVPTSHRNHRENENISPPDRQCVSRNLSQHMDRLSRLGAPQDSVHVDNESLPPRSQHSICPEEWSEEVLALALNIYEENWKLPGNILKMIHAVIQPMLCPKQSVDTSQATHSAVAEICQAIKNKCLGGMNT